MPCTYYLPGEEQELLNADLDRVTSLLCLVLSELEQDAALHALLKRHHGLRKFWEEHKERDRRRVEENRKQAKKERLRRSAEAKLTKEELAALNLDEP